MVSNSIRDPYASEIDVAAELDSVGIDATQFEESNYTRWLTRAVKIISRRLPTERDEGTLEELEILVAAHMAYPSGTSYKGQSLSSITQESAQISFDNSARQIEGPGGYASPFWQQAVMIEPKLAEDPGDWWAVTRTGR